MKILICLFALCFATLAEIQPQRKHHPPTPAPPPAPAPQPGINFGAQIANDMNGPNEDHPMGVPLSWDWANGSFISMGNNPQGWNAMTPWGLVYPAASGNPAVNTRVNIRAEQAWVLSKSSGVWSELSYTDSPDGAAYLYDFSGDSNKPADIITLPDGSISVTAGNGYNFHFYPQNRATINPNDIGGIVTLFEARLVVADPSKPDDRNIAKFLCSSGGDYYPALTGGWPGNLSFNTGIGGGKFKYVEIPWRSFSFTTMTAAQLSSNPPPIDLTGILP